MFGYTLIPLSFLFDFRHGLHKDKRFFGTGATPFIRYKDVYENRALTSEGVSGVAECTSDEEVKLRVRRGDVLFTASSETAEEVGLSSVMLEEMSTCVFNAFTIKGSPKTDLLLPEYCAFCFSDETFRKYATTRCTVSTRASLRMKTLRDYLLPVPDIEKQRQIANTLSAFTAICTDLSSGLPAEIEARRRQYEYYRDKLLAFD